MNDAILFAAAAQFTRDEMRRAPRPFAVGCEHDMEQLPIVDLMLDERCRKCGGFTSRSPAARVGH